MAPVTVDPVEAPQKNEKNSLNKCKLCPKGVRKGIRCDKCLWWLHIKCAQVDSSKISDDYYWICTSCLDEEEDAKRKEEVDSKDKVISLLMKDLAMLHQKNKLLEQEKEKLETELATYKQNVSFSSVVQKKAKPRTTEPPYPLFTKNNLKASKSPNRSDRGNENTSSDKLKIAEEPASKNRESPKPNDFDVSVGNPLKSKFVRVNLKTKDTTKPANGSDSDKKVPPVQPQKISTKSIPQSVFPPEKVM
jgi:hypothetical protein